MQTKRLDIYIDFKRGATFIDDAEELKQSCKACGTQQKTWQHLNF